MTSVLGESAKNAVDTFAAKLDLSGPAEKAKGALGKVGQAAGGLAKGAAVATGVLGGGRDRAARPRPGCPPPAGPT